MDLYFDAFKHSHIFADLEIAVKKELSLVMRSEFLLPGEFLLKPGDKKAKMIYIYSGRIQV